MTHDSPESQPLRVAAILLAAGESSRMAPRNSGPKQLLTFDGQTLLRRAVDTAVNAGLVPVTVVLGAHAEALRAELAGLPVEIADNPHWQAGMGTSIRAGLAAALCRAPETEAVIILLCDQPLVRSDDLRALVHTHLQTHRPLVAASFAGTLGPPALIARNRFALLQALPDAAGAKAIFVRTPEDLATHPLPHAAADIDTPDDYARLSSPS